MRPRSKDRVWSRQASWQPPKWTSMGPGPCGIYQDPRSGSQELNLASSHGLPAAGSTYQDSGGMDGRKQHVVKKM